MTRKPAAPKIRKMMTYESIYAGYDAHGRNVWVEHLPRGTWSMQKFTLPRPAAKSEIAKAVADATLRANRRACRIVKRYFGVEFLAEQNGLINKIMEKSK